MVVDAALTNDGTNLTLGRWGESILGHPRSSIDLRIKPMFLPVS